MYDFYASLHVLLSDFPRYDSCWLQPNLCDADVSLWLWGTLRYHQDPQQMFYCVWDNVSLLVFKCRLTLHYRNGDNRSHVLNSVEGTHRRRLENFNPIRQFPSVGCSRGLPHVSWPFDFHFLTFDILVIVSCMWQVLLASCTCRRVVSVGQLYLSVVSVASCFLGWLNPFPSGLVSFSWWLYVQIAAYTDNIPYILIKACCLGHAMMGGMP